MLQQGIQSFNGVVSSARCLEDRGGEPPTAEVSKAVTLPYGLQQTRFVSQGYIVAVYA